MKQTNPSAPEIHALASVGNHKLLRLTLIGWFLNNLTNPFPQPDELSRLCEAEPHVKRTHQASEWFRNARRQVKRKIDCCFENVFRLSWQRNVGLVVQAPETGTSLVVQRAAVHGVLRAASDLCSYEKQIKSSNFRSELSWLESLAPASVLDNPASESTSPTSGTPPEQFAHLDITGFMAARTIFVFASSFFQAASLGSALQDPGRCLLPGELVQLGEQMLPDAKAPDASSDSIAMLNRFLAEIYAWSRTFLQGSQGLSEASAPCSASAAATTSSAANLVGTPGATEAHSSLCPGTSLSAVSSSKAKHLAEVVGILHQAQILSTHFDVPPIAPDKTEKRKRAADEAASTPRIRKLSTSSPISAGLGAHAQQLSGGVHTSQSQQYGLPAHSMSAGHSPATVLFRLHGPAPHGLGSADMSGMGGVGGMGMAPQQLNRLSPTATAIARKLQGDAQTVNSEQRRAQQSSTPGLAPSHPTALQLANLSVPGTNSLSADGATDPQQVEPSRPPPFPNPFTRFNVTGRLRSHNPIGQLLGESGRAMSDLYRSGSSITPSSQAGSVPSSGSAQSLWAAPQWQRDMPTQLQPLPTPIHVPGSGRDTNTGAALQRLLRSYAGGLVGGNNSGIYASPGSQGGVRQSAPSAPVWSHIAPGMASSAFQPSSSSGTGHHPQAEAVAHGNVSTQAGTPDQQLTVPPLQAVLRSLWTKTAGHAREGRPQQGSRSVIEVPPTAGRYQPLSPHSNSWPLDATATAAAAQYPSSHPGLMQQRNVPTQLTNPNPPGVVQQLLTALSGEPKTRATQGGGAIHPTLGTSTPLRGTDIGYGSGQAPSAADSLAGMAGQRNSGIDLQPQVRQLDHSAPAASRSLPSFHAVAETVEQLGLRRGRRPAVEPGQQQQQQPQQQRQTPLSQPGLHSLHVWGNSRSIPSLAINGEQSPEIEARPLTAQPVLAPPTAGGGSSESGPLPPPLLGPRPLHPPPVAISHSRRDGSEIDSAEHPVIQLLAGHASNVQAALSPTRSLSHERGPSAMHRMATGQDTSKVTAEATAADKVISSSDESGNPANSRGRASTRPRRSTAPGLGLAYQLEAASDSAASSAIVETSSSDWDGEPEESSVKRSSLRRSKKTAPAQQRRRRERRRTAASAMGSSL